jgi:hypothetical protein
MTDPRYYTQQIDGEADEILGYVVIDRARSNSIDGDHCICLCDGRRYADLIADAMNRICFDL